MDDSDIVTRVGNIKIKYDRWAKEIGDARAIKIGNDQVEYNPYSRKITKIGIHQISYDDYGKILGVSGLPAVYNIQAEKITSFMCGFDEGSRAGLFCNEYGALENLVFDHLTYSFSLGFFLDID